LPRRRFGIFHGRRVKVPSGVKLMPHRHPEDRIYTVMSGVFYIGLGETFDGDKVTAYPPR
jgi:quercetin dioxygenase-like cupin family protein